MTDTGVGIQVTTTHVKLLMEALARQFPFATYKALNRLVLEAQQHQRTWDRFAFHIRQETYWKLAVKIPKGGFATKTRLEAILAMVPPGKTPKPEIFQRQQYGGRRVPVHGRRRLALPTEEVPRTSKDLISRTFRPSRLRHEFFVPIKGKSGAYGLFQRISKRMKGYSQTPPGTRYTLKEDPNVRFMYYLIPSAEIDPALQFFKNAQETFNTHWTRIFDEELIKAFKTARIKGVRKA